MNDPSALSVSDPCDGPLRGRGAATVIGCPCASLSFVEHAAAATTSVRSWTIDVGVVGRVGAVFVTAIGLLVPGVFVPSVTSVAVTVVGPPVSEGDREGPAAGDERGVGAAGRRPRPMT